MEIDFVIPWVDDSDSEWLSERNKYEGSSDSASAHGQDKRYRDWGLLRYFFRSVALNAPWVRKVHFLTYGHLPKWLDTSNPKLHIVKHEDYIPHEYLPTFNSNVIELNANRIEGLAEQFVLFNDDLIVLNRTSEDDYFHKGLPRATAVLSAGGLARGDEFYVPFNVASVLSTHFVPLNCVKSHPLKWLSPAYGTMALRTVLMLVFPSFKGFYEPHLCNSFLKSTFDEVWAEEKDELERTSSHRFRQSTDISNWLMKDWQCAKGDFYPRPISFGKSFNLGIDFDSTLEEAESYLRGRKGKVVCLNDGDLTPEQYETARTRILACLDELFPDKCEFEL